MDFLKFDKKKCTLCSICIKKCPFGALNMAADGIEVDDKCRMCKLCIKECPENAISFEQKRDSVDKSKWNDFLIYAEQENGTIHPVTFELIGEAQKMAKKVDYKVSCCIVGAEGTEENAKKLLKYGVDKVYVYEHPGYSGLKADSFTDAVADCISRMKPNSVLIGATPFGRSLAPRLSTRFHTGLTADCTVLDIKTNTDLVQIRPAFGGNVMAQISITHSRPQFATVRYRVMDAAHPTSDIRGQIIKCPVTNEMARSKIEVLSSIVAKRQKTLEEEDIIVAVGRGAKSDAEIEMCRELADALGGQLAFSRPLIEKGYADTSHQIGLSGRTVRPKLIITAGISGAIQFTSCMDASECIVAINTDKNAPIFNVAHYCIVDDLSEVIPRLTALAKKRAEKSAI